MIYVGMIKKIKNMVVSDPMYGSDIWCRYENDNVNMKNAFIKVKIEEEIEKYEKYTITGKAIEILIEHKEGTAKIKKDKIKYPSGTKVKDFEIGMDSACVALGINECADEILQLKDEWQPDCALKTLTDGLFGNIVEGQVNGKVNFIYISGYIDEDAGYTENDLLNYIKKQFNISDLQQIEENSNSKELKM